MNGKCRIIPELAIDAILWAGVRSGVIVVETVDVLLHDDHPEEAGRSEQDRRMTPKRTEQSVLSRDQAPMSLQLVSAQIPRSDFEQLVLKLT